MKMTVETNDAGALDARLFDRLADGELDDDGRRALLSRLDEIPGGWRRCALAFLEAQAWRSELRLTAGRSDTAVLHPAISRVERSRGARARRATLLVLALVAAFSCGWLTRPDGAAVHNDQSAGDLKAVVQRDADGVKPPDEAASNSSFASREPPPGIRLAGLLTFQIDESGQSREVRVPVLEGPGIDSRWLLDQPATIRASIVKELQRRGHKVEAHRQLLTVDLKDGRKVLLPVDQVDVRFANRVFQ
jgi:hypothetical protein